MILFSPQKLTNGTSLQSLAINKSGKSVSYNEGDLTTQEIKKRFPGIAKETIDRLKVFGKAEVQNTKVTLSAKYARKWAGEDFDANLESVLLREVHQHFAWVLPFIATQKSYHRIKDSSGRIRTAPCAFSTSRVRLSFEVVKRGKRLDIATTIDADGNIYNLQDLGRYHFFLEQNNTYWLLGYRDYQTLQWLEEQKDRYGNNEEDFRKEIVRRLEERYKVNRNGFFNKNLIDSLPQSQLMVSELSGSFLMLTPQWLYDGILIEGPFGEEEDILRNGNSFIIKRNQEAENDFITILKGLHPTFENQRNGYFFLKFEEAKKKQWFFKAYHQLINLNVQLVGMDMLSHFRYSEHKAETKFIIKEQNEDETFAIMSVHFGKEEIPLASLQKILKSGQHHLLLKDDKIAVLDDDWLQEYSTILLHGRIDGNEIRLERWLAISLNERNSKDGILKSTLKNEWWDQWEQWQRSELTIPVPERVQVRELRPYQQKGYEWMTLLANARAGACLADDMGLGKTLQAICFLANRLESSPHLKHLVVCPSSLIYNWQQELQKFAPDIKVQVYHGASRKQEWLSEPETEILITSYGTVRSDIDLLCQVYFNAVVLDESHNIKNPYAQISLATSRLRAKSRLALSGTPVMNNTFDLYSQLNFLLPKLFGSRQFFRNQYSDPIDRDHNPEKTKALQKLTAPFILRRTKEQVATDLPEKTELTLWCEMGPMQTEQYDIIRESIRHSIFLDIERDGFSGSKLSIIQGITRLRQVCNSPLLLPGEDQICEDSIKTDVLIDELKNNLKGHKVLVFSQFTTMLELLAAEMERNDISFYHFNGQTPPQRRMEMVQAFQQEDNTTNVFLISLMAGNAGLNLTAADYVFLFDPWWNTAVQQQAIDRTHRIGQTRNVFAYKMACRDTIEEKIMVLQERKKVLAEELIVSDNDFVKSLTMEDVKYLLA